MKLQLGRTTLLSGLLIAATLPSAEASYFSTVAAASSTGATAQPAQDEARVERAMAQSGDLDMILKAVLDLRPRIEHWVSDRGSDDIAKIGAELDRLLAPQAIRQDIATHIASGLGREDIAQVEAWASNPRMAAINAVLVDPMGTRPMGEFKRATPERLEKLTRLVRASLLSRRLENPNKGMEALMVDFSKAVDPHYQPMDTSHFPEEMRPPDEDESLASSFLAQRLAHVDEADIDRFLAFAESEVGQKYFGALSAGMALGFGDWRSDFLVSARYILRDAPRMPHLPPNYVEDLVSREIGIEHAMAKSGDLAVILKAHSAVRPQVEALIQELNPEAMPKLAPELDRILAPQALLEDVAIQMGAQFAAGGLDKVEAWSSKPSMVAINAALLSLSEAPPPHGSSGSVTPEARERFLRIARATHIAKRLTSAQEGLQQLSTEVVRVFDPSFRPFVMPEHPALASEDALVDYLLAPTLAFFTAAEIDEYLAFAESEAGYDYFQAVTLALQLSLGDRRGELLSAIEANAGPEPAGQDIGFDELLASARHLISINALSDAQAVLIRAERLRGDDSQVQMLLGEVATHLRDGPRPSRGQLRTEPFPEFFAEAERRLARAIELDPTNGRAHVLLARAKFLQSKDSEAAALLAQAKKIDPELAWLRVNLADLASVQGRYDEAIALYREVLRLPEREPNVHYWALVRSRVAFAGSDRLEEYTAVGRQYMQDKPEDQDYPLVFAEHLLYSGKDDAEALEVLEQTNPRRNPRLRQQLLAKALAGLAHASRERTGSLDAQSRLWLQRAIELSGGSESNLVRDLAIEPTRLEPMLTVIHASSSPKSLATQALYPAMFPRRMDQIKALVEAGADLNAPLGVLPMTPLASAAMGRDLDLFRLLLELGADPERARISGQPLEEWMSSFTHEEVIAEMSKLIETR
jgi:tetratricopeptide (TPR) repeat protein